MIKKLVSLLVVLSITTISFAQYYKRSQVDSLKKVLPAQIEEERVNTLLALTEAYIPFNLDTALTFAELSGGESTKLGYEWGYCKSLYFHAKISMHNVKYSELEKTFKRCSNWFRSHGYPEDAILSDFELHECLKNSHGLKKSVKHCELTLERAKKTNDPLLIAQACFELSKYNDEFLEGNQHNGIMDTAYYYFNICTDSAWIISMKQFQQLSLIGTEKGALFTEQMYETGKRWGNNKNTMHTALWTMCYSQIVLRNIDSAHYYYEEIVDLAEDLGSMERKVRGIETIAFGYFWMDSLDQALYYSQQSLDYHKKLGRYTSIARDYNMLGDLYLRMGDYENAAFSLVKAVETADLSNDVYTKFSSNRKLGELYGLNEEYEKAEEIYFKSIEWMDTTLVGRVKNRMRGNAYHELGQIYHRQDRFELARECYRESVKELEKIELRKALIPSLDIVETYLEMGMLDSAGMEYEKVLGIYDLSLLQQSAIFYWVQGRLFVEQGKFREGISALNVYEGKLQKVEFSEEREQIYFQLYKAYDGIGEDRKALDAYVNYKVIQDSIREGKALEHAAETQSEYEISLKEAEIKDLQQQKELSDLRLEQQNSQLELRQLYIIVLVFGFLVLGLIGYLLFRRFRFKKEEEKKEMETRLELESFQARQKAELAEVKNTLFANISHEFRTPLTLIQVPIKEQLKKSDDADKPVLEGVIKNTNNLLKMVDELLDLSKMESGTVELQKSQFDLSAFLSQIKSNFVPLFKNKNIDFKWESGLTRANFEGDENRLKIVLNNILKNAYSHTPENGNVSCAINATTNKALSISVRNSGSRIDEKDLPHIFERYYRASEDGYSGTGIGLALSKQIIEMHGGTIVANNLAENNVMFEVNLPQGLITNGALEASQKELAKEQLVKDEIYTNGNGQHQTQNRPHILVVEDNDEMRGLLDTILKDEFKLDFAEDGEQGEALSVKLQPDLILSDVMMPKKDGFELLSVLKQNFGTSHIPVILLTARADSTSRISGLNLDADGYVGKPFDPTELKARINNLLRQRKKLHKLFSENPLIYAKDIKCTPIDAGFLKNAREVLESHFADGDFSVNEFCSEMALNRNSVNNKLKALANQSTAEYIKNFRLEKAVKLLIETELTMTDVYVQTGFNSPQAFNKVFKKKFNCTPSDYRLKTRHEKV